jgi:hypothetical protein
MSVRARPQIPHSPALRLSWRHIVVALLALPAAALVLRGMGRIWWCNCGQPFLWSGEIMSTHNSQHLLDPYTFTHILHGIALYGIAWLLLGSRSTPAWRAVIVVAIEAAWEIFENTSFVIERYREATISLDYYGDSILNSLADIVACAGGITIAMISPVWVSVAVFVGVEAVLLVWIRDSLLLNILMLFMPLETLKEWQMGGMR